MLDTHQAHLLNDQRECIWFQFLLYFVLRKQFRVYFSLSHYCSLDLRHINFQPIILFKFMQVIYSILGGAGGGGSGFRGRGGKFSRIFYVNLNNYFQT